MKAIEPTKPPEKTELVTIYPFQSSVALYIKTSLMISIKNAKLGWNVFKKV